MAWYTKSDSFEIYAYDQIGKCYFYLQIVDKATAYSNRVLHGILEIHNSSERLVSDELFERELKLKPR